MSHPEGGKRHAKMLAQIPVGQAAPCALACWQGDHGLLGEAGLQISIPQGTGALLQLYVCGMIYGREKGIQNGKVRADDM